MPARPLGQLGRVAHPAQGQCRLGGIGQERGAQRPQPVPRGATPRRNLAVGFHIREIERLRLMGECHDPRVLCLVAGVLGLLRPSLVGHRVHPGVVENQPRRAAAYVPFVPQHPADLVRRRP